MREKALQYLKNDPLHHVGMIDPILRETADILYAENDGVLLKEKNSQVYMISVDTQETGRKLLPMMSSCPFAELFQPFLIEDIKAELGFTDVMACRQAVYEKEDRLPIDTDLSIANLSSEWYDTVHSHYGMLDEQDMRRLLEGGSIWGGFCDGQLAGFIGNHLEGTIGLLEIFPEYRKKGYGLALESFMVNRMLDQGRIPYTQFEVGNNISEKIQRKLGFEISKKELYWLNP